MKIKKPIAKLAKKERYLGMKTKPKTHGNLPKKRRKNH